MTHRDTAGSAGTAHALLPQHQALLAASAIPPEVAAARQYASLTVQAAVRRLGFSATQAQVPALLIPIWDVFGEVRTYQLRPDTPRIVDGKPRKYETPAGSRMVLDVPPMIRSALPDPAVPLFITEGARKADAAVGQGLCCVALLGVWNFRGTNDRGGKTMLADWEQVALNGRPVSLAFDSDALTKPAVHAALERLVTWLRRRKAEVAIIALPAGPGGVKTGLDDYLAAGHTVDDLLALASPELRPLAGDTGHPGDEATATAGPYAATNRGLLWHKETRDGLTELLLANFSARITGDILADDGAETRRSFELQVQLHGREHPVTVPAAQFAGLSWVPELLGASAVVGPGMGLRDHTRAAIQLLSGAIPTRHVYAHTGWRRLEGHWAYLHAGGAVTASGDLPAVEVNLDGPLAQLLLPVGGTTAEVEAGLAASLRLLDLLPADLAVPLLGAVYVAPLREALGGEAPDFVPWFHGPSGTFKSELLALAQAHYGPFDRQHLPLSFTATANAVERVTFTAKDALLAVDDYHPASDPREAQEMARVASRLLRGAGNAAGRARLRADTTLRPALVPRCLPIVSGERLVEGHSTVARLFAVPVAPGSIDPGALSQAQADRERYPWALRGYLQWLAGRLDREGDAPFLTRFHQLRHQAQQEEGHRREPGQVAHLVLGLETVLQYGVELGVVSATEREERVQAAWTVLLAHAREHGAAQAEEAPHRLFLRLLSDGLASKRVYLETRDGLAPHDGQQWGWERVERTDADGEPVDELRHLGGGTLLGTVEWEWVLLVPEVTYQFVVTAARTAGRVFPVDLKTLLRRLEEAGLIATEGTEERRLVNTWVGGGTRRVIKLRRDALEVRMPEHEEPGSEDARSEEGGADPAPEPSAPPTDPAAATQAEVFTGEAHIPDIPSIPESREEGEPVDAEVMEWTAVP